MIFVCVKVVLFEAMPTVTNAAVADNAINAFVLFFISDVLLKNTTNYNTYFF